MPNQYDIDQWKRPPGFPDRDLGFPGTGRSGMAPFDPNRDQHQLPPPKPPAPPPSNTMPPKGTEEYEVWLRKQPWNQPGYKRPPPPKSQRPPGFPDRDLGFPGTGRSGMAPAGKMQGMPVAAFDSAAAEEGADRRFGPDISPGRGENERIQDYEIEQDRLYGPDISPGRGENERLEKMPYGTGPGQSGTQFGYEPRHAGKPADAFTRPTSRLVADSMAAFSPAYMKGHGIDERLTRAVAGGELSREDHLALFDYLMSGLQGKLGGGGGGGGRPGLHPRAGMHRTLGAGAGAAAGLL